MENLPARNWVAACSARLQQHWKTIDPQRLDDLAQDLARDERLRWMTPAEAAVEWLSLGIPTVR